MIGNVSDYNTPNNMLDVDFQTRDNTIIESGTGELYLKGVASTNDTDTNNDIVTAPALQSMLDWIRRGKVNLHYDHKHTLDGIIGSIVQAEIIGNELFITARILPNAREMIKNYIRHGISLGLSVGGKAIRSPVNPNIITDYLLMEISITPIPALMESKGTVEEVETPTCITGACYIALENDKENNNETNKFKYDNKTYKTNNELITMNSYNQISNCASAQELEQIEQYLYDIARKVDYNNKYGFDNKSYQAEMDNFINTLQADPKYDIIGMCSSFNDEDLKNVSDLVNTVNNQEYQAIMRDAGIESMTPRDLDVKMWGTILNIAKLVPLIYNAVTGGIDIYQTLKKIRNGNKPQAPPVPEGNWKRRFRKRPNQYNMPNQYIDRLQNPLIRDIKAFNYVGEPMPAYGMEQQEPLPNELMNTIEQIFMRMFNEAMYQKEKVMEDNVINNVMSQMQGLGGNMANPVGMGQPPMQEPPMPPMEEANESVEPVEAFEEAPLTPEEEAAAEEEEFEEQAVRKKSKKGKNKKGKKDDEEELDTKNYNYPEPPYYDIPFLDTSRANVPDSKVSKMQDIIDKQAQSSQEAAGTGFTRHRNEYGEFIG